MTKEARKDTIARLEELLEAKDEQLTELQEQLDKVVEVEDYHKFKWMHHRIVPNEDDAPGLPVPRLQLRYMPNDPDWYSFDVMYELVYKHYEGAISEGFNPNDPEADRGLRAIPLSQTRIGGGGHPMRHGKLDTPIRDGVHIHFDSEQFGGLPKFAIIEGKAVPVDDELNPRKLTFPWSSCKEAKKP